MSAPGKAMPVTMLLALSVLLACAAATQGAATPVKDGDAGTIGACLAQADGSTVKLTCEQVMWRGRSGKSFAVKEWFERMPQRPRLLVVSTTRLPVQPYWSVDVSGTLHTLAGSLPDGTAIEQRVLVVSPADVYVYCDSKGRPIPCPPPKGVDVPGLTRRSLADFTGSSGVSTLSGELPPLPDSPESSPPAPGSKDSLKHLPDGAAVSVNGALVTAAFNGFFYTERSDRSFGIRISSTEWSSPGDLVDVTGRTATVGGERAVIADSVTNLGYNYPLPAPLGMNNRALGGGAVDAYTPAVADGAGLNNTGLLVKVWGKVTSADSGTRIYELTDGSVTTDGQTITIKVYDSGWPWDPFPTVGEFWSVGGVSSAEIPEGSATSIRVLRHATPPIPSYQPGNGTISGTVTATGADGQTVKVYCSRASTLATFTGDTANYTLNVPFGDHAVTATMRGYKTATQLVNVGSWSPNQVCDFVLSGISRRIDVVASPPRIPPDGATQTTITAIVRDEEGRRYANEPVTWSVDLGTVISSDSTTDAVGEARLVLQAPGVAGTASVTVTVAGQSVIGYAEFNASPTAPTIRIVSPVAAAIVSGDVKIEATMDDPGGTHPGTVAVSFSLDGQFLDSALPNRPSTLWQSYSVPNGTHTIRAAVMDGDREIGYSQSVTVQVSNAVHSIHASSYLIYPETPGQDSLTVEGDRADGVNGPWEVRFWQPDVTSPSRIISGTGSHILATWDGRDESGVATTGQYRVEVYLPDTGQSTGGNVLYDFLVQLFNAWPKALVVEGFPFTFSASTCKAVADVLEAKGYLPIYLNYRNATWGYFYYYMVNYQPKVFYIYSHGSYEIRNDNDCNPPLIPQMSGFMLKNAWVHSYRPQKPDGSWYDEYPEPGQNAWANLDPDPEHHEFRPYELKQHYISELGFLTYGSPLKLAMTDVCLAGRVGGQYVANLNDPLAPYGGQQGNGVNDMASMLGIYDNAWTIGASYLSYFEVSYDSPEYVELTKKLFGSLRTTGRTLDWTIGHDLEPDSRFHQPLNPPGFVTYNNGPCLNWRYYMPSYPNLRVFGNPWGTTLDPY